MQAPRVFAKCVHVSREISPFWTVWTRGGIGPIIGVEHIARPWIDDTRRLIKRVKTAPVSGGVGAVDGFAIVKAIIAAGNELRVEIGDLALIVGEQSIVRRIGLQLRDFQERLQRGGLGAQIGLGQGLDRPIHHSKTDPPPALAGNNRAAMGEIGGEVA